MAEEKKKSFLETLAEGFKPTAERYKAKKYDRRARKRFQQEKAANKKAEGKSNWGYGFGK